MEKETVARMLSSSSESIDPRTTSITAATTIMPTRTTATTEDRQLCLTLELREEGDREQLQQPQEISTQGFLHDAQLPTQSASPKQSQLNNVITPSSSVDHGVIAPVQSQFYENRIHNDIDNVKKDDNVHNNIHSNSSENDDSNNNHGTRNLEQSDPIQTRAHEQIRNTNDQLTSQQPQGLTTIPAAKSFDHQQKTVDTQEKYIFDYIHTLRPPPTSNNNHGREGRGEDIIVPHLPFLETFSQTSLQPLRYTKVPVVEEYVDTSRSSTPILPLSNNPRDTLDVETTITHDLYQDRDSLEVSRNATSSDMQETIIISPSIHPQSSLPSSSNQVRDSASAHILFNPHQNTQQQQHQQPNQIQQRKHTHYPPTLHRTERRSMIARFSFIRSSICRGTTDTASINTPVLPTSFVMVDMDENQILTDPYISSITPPRPSLLSSSIVSSSVNASGKNMAGSAPFWHLTAVSRWPFDTTHSNRNTSRNLGNNNTSHSSSRLDDNISHSHQVINHSMISPTADPQVAAHIAEALRMYGIPSLHQPTVVHPFQQSSATSADLASSSSSSLSPSRPTSMMPVLVHTGGGSAGYGPIQRSRFLRRGRPGSYTSTHDIHRGPSRVVRVWAALTGRSIASTPSSPMTTTSTTTTTTTATMTTTGIASTLDGISSNSNRDSSHTNSHSSDTTTTNPSSGTGTRVITMATVESRTTNPTRPRHSSLSAPEYGELPFVQQPQRSTIVIPSLLSAQASTLLRSRPSSVCGSVVITTAIDDGSSSGEGGGNGDRERGGGDRGGHGQQEQRWTRMPTLENGDRVGDEMNGRYEVEKDVAASKFSLRDLLCGCGR